VSRVKSEDLAKAEALSERLEDMLVGLRAETQMRREVLTKRFQDSQVVSLNVDGKSYELGPKSREVVRKALLEFTEKHLLEGLEDIKQQAQNEGGFGSRE
jgi:hypothetical protein